MRLFRNIGAIAAAVVFSTALFLVLTGLPALTQGNPGYKGMGLPADFIPFSSKSPWNTSIPANVSVDQNSARMIENLKKKAGILKGNMVHWSVPLFVIDSAASPKVDVKSSSSNMNPLVDPENKGSARNIPIPDGVWPDPKGDGHMLLVDPVEKKSWDFAKARRNPDGSWIASRVDIWDLTGSGYREKPFTGNYWWTYGARGSGMPLIAGLIRPEEIERGEIRHALVCSTPVNRKSSTPGGKLELCSPTASRTDGNGVGLEFIPEGARLQLDPALNVDSLPLSKATKVIAKAMQKYGVYVGDNAPTFVLYFQNLGADGKVWKKYNYFEDLKNIPIEKFRVLECNLKIQGQK
ncbi:MAG: hypothetical protein EPN22_15565 [Nitrospirae bacterium]|nr:MAG: hypothetical protein EPN22_15565 [Nitrospirota bacterium]